MPTDVNLRSHFDAALGEARDALDKLMGNELALAEIEHAASLLIHTVM